MFATTAANGRESSYACYWDEELRTYLGDVYSIKWMEDSDSVNIANRIQKNQLKSRRAITIVLNNEEEILPSIQIPCTKLLIKFIPFSGHSQEY